MAQERANGLYGPTAFLIANFLIGLPFLCSNTVSVLADISYHRLPIRGRFVLADKSSTWGRGVLHLSRSLIPGSYRRRISSHLDFIHISHFRRCPCADSVRERPLDDGGWFLGQPDGFKCFLALHVLSDRLSKIHVCRPGSKPDDWKHLHLRCRLSLRICHQLSRSMSH